jgi:hypothetical protein
MTRKDFIQKTVWGICMGISGAILLPNCSGSEDPQPDTIRSCIDNGAESLTISQNHGHVVDIPASDITSTTSKTYNITGTADHPHFITITPDQFLQLQENDSISVMTSNNNGHTHSIVVRCSA